MNDRLLERLACPACGAVMLRAGTPTALLCAGGHTFPVVDDIPRLLPVSEGFDGRSIRASFSGEWSELRHGEDRPWGQTLDLRREIALRELDCEPQWLEGKRVLDAGCGAGKLSYILADWGARVTSTDISSSVGAARDALAGRDHGRIDFVQADLNDPPFQPGSFDLIFSGGVLHHNADTRKALEALLGLLAPGGTIYIWLYHPLPGLAHKVRALARRAIVPLPSPVQRAIFRPWAAQSYLRHRLRVATGREQGETAVNYRERLITLLDHYTPRYRWEHTPDEVRGWYSELGLVDARHTEPSPYGFGMLARVPGEREPALTAA